MKKAAVAGFGLTLALLALWSSQPSKSLPAGATANLVVIHKAARRLDLYENGSLLKSYLTCPAF
jgi:hypothetical protein